MANYNPKFTCACKSPRNNNIIFIGTNGGQIYRVEIKNLSEIQKNLSLNFSCIDKISPYNREIKPFYSPVRAIKRLDVSNLISISTNGGIKLINLLLKKYIEVQAEKSDTEHRLWRILVISQKKFIVVGSYGKMQLWENENNIWKKKIDKRHGSPSFFCLNWYNKHEDKIISNDYRGSTELWNTNLKFLKSWNLASNIQESIKIDNRLITVTYFGDTIVYLKDEDNFIQIERFSCSKMKSVSIIRQISNGEEFLAGFNNKIFVFDKSFTEYRSTDIPCIDLISIGNIELILTAYDLVPLDRSKLVIPENYIKYKYIHVGFVGNSRSGKTTICKYLIKNRYITEIPSSLGSHIWLHELSNKKKIYYIDMAGQESELPYYLPKLKTCQIIFVLFRHNQSKKEFMQAIDYYNLLSNKLPSCQIYLIESMMDEREGISKRFKEKKLNQNNIPMKNWIKISVKEGININSIISILNDEGIWDSAYPITESSINNAILSILQELYETKSKYVSIEEMQIPLKKKIW